LVITAGLFTDRVADAVFPVPPPIEVTVVKLV
jgi:hypothetical protein